MVVAIMKGYIIFVIILMLLYTARHFYFTIVRLLGRQRLYYNDILTDRMKSISVLFLCIMRNRCFPMFWILC